MELENINPSVFKKSEERRVTKQELDNDVKDEIDSREVFGKILINLKMFSSISFSHNRLNKKHK